MFMVFDMRINEEVVVDSAGVILVVGRVPDTLTSDDSERLYAFLPTAKVGQYCAFGPFMIVRTDGEWQRPNPVPTLDQLRPGLLARHVRTGGVYEVVCVAKLEKDRSTEMVVYRGLDGRTWVLPVDEFLDGRFTL